MTCSAGIEMKENLIKRQPTFFEKSFLKRTVGVCDEYAPFNYASTRGASINRRVVLYKIPFRVDLIL